MPLMRAMSDWYNSEHEGHVERGQEFETSEYRATDLVRAGLAMYAISEVRKTVVTADPPPPEPEPAAPPKPTAAPRKAPAKAPAKRKR
jgi:hypothetical protein